MNTATAVEDDCEDGARNAPAPGVMTALVVRVRGEYREMPGLRLTVRQAARLFGIPPDVASTVLSELRRTAVLSRSSDGVYFLDY
jgi:hypothetical protein